MGIQADVAGQVIMLDERTFSTGSRGYQGVAKVFISGKKYQANFMLVEVGSKPDASGGTRPKAPKK